jgi:polysaccharide chain length determinant protein (PEP-CTERM system associated)
MQKKRFAGINDYLALFVRRRWLVVITFIALAAFATLLATMVPKIYCSETMLQVQQREVPANFVPDLITGTTNQRLGAIEQTILSRTNLLKIINEFGSGMVGYDKLNDDQRVVKLRTQIRIEFVSEKLAGNNAPIDNVRISYQDRNPELAQKIAARLATLFMEQESRTRETQVFGTTEFLSSELSKVADQLQESETRLKVLQERYRYQLPAELQTNLRTLDRLQLQKNSNVEALDRNRTMHLNLEQMISSTPPTLVQEVKPDPVNEAGNPSENPLVSTYRKKKQEYKELLAKYEEKFPSVQRLREELEKMKKQIPPKDLAAMEQPAPAPEPISAPNPAYQKLEAQLREVKTEIEIREREKKTIESEMALYAKRVQATPGVEQEMAAIVRLNADLTKQHEDLKDKLAQARLAESLESKQKGGQFMVVDPANLPIEPVTPSRKKFWLIGCALSLGIGLSAAFIIGFFDRRIWTQDEVERYMGTPVLVEIPRLMTGSDLKRTRKNKVVHASVAVLSMAVYMGGLYYLYLSHSSALRILDPVMENLMERLVSK